MRLIDLTDIPTGHLNELLNKLLRWIEFVRSFDKTESFCRYTNLPAQGSKFDETPINKTMNIEFHGFLVNLKFMRELMHIQFPKPGLFSILSVKGFQNLFPQFIVRHVSNSSPIGETV